MSFKLEPAAIISQELLRKLVNCTDDISNEWFFYDGAFSSSILEHNSCNTWLHENFVCVHDGEIIAYYEGTWTRPLDIISGFRMIFFNKKKSIICLKGFFKYLDYLFINRGCMAFNWTVAHKNVHALKQYERFISGYCGHKVGERLHAQKSYTGKISNINLYEIGREEYFHWKSKSSK